MISYSDFLNVKKYIQNRMNQDYLKDLQKFASISMFSGFQGNSEYTMHKKPTIIFKN